MLQNKISLLITNQAYSTVSAAYLFNLFRNILLPSKASLALLRKQNGPTGSANPITAPSFAILS